MPKFSHGSEEHTLARADYFAGLLQKTSDPVYWEGAKLHAAREALQRVRDTAHAHRYQTPIAILESALHKASIR